MNADSRTIILLAAEALERIAGAEEGKKLGIYHVTVTALEAEEKGEG